MSKARAALDIILSHFGVHISHLPFSLYVLLKHFYIYYPPNSSITIKGEVLHVTTKSITISNICNVVQFTVTCFSESYSFELS